MSVDQSRRPAAGRFGSFRALSPAAAALMLAAAAPGTGHAGPFAQGQRFAQAPADLVLAQADPAPKPAPADAPAAEKPPEVTETPAVVVDDNVAQALLGKAVQSANGDDMGRIVDVIVDRAGAIRAAVIDFGGFLGVGTRKIAVDWRILNFAKSGEDEHIVADLSQEQLRKAPPYKSGEPVVIVGRAQAGPAAQQAPAAASPPAAQAPSPNPPAPDSTQNPPSPGPQNPSSTQDAPATNR